MSHPFGDLLSQHLHRKHGLSQSKLAAGILQEPAIITHMCKGERLTGPQARERVLAIVGWLHKQGALSKLGEANALLMAAGLAPLRTADPTEAGLVRQLSHSAHLAHPAPTPPTNNAPRLIASEFSLVGRQTEWEMLCAAWRTAVHSQAHVVAIAGEAGIGKTRLAEELLTDVQRQGYRVARTRAYALEGRLAYAPVADWLRTAALADELRALDAVWRTEIARLLPELLIEDATLSPPQPLTERWQLKRLFEALLQVFSAVAQHNPVLLVLDDLQWCDPETLEWLQYLLSAAPQLKLLVVGTVRDTEVDAEHPLHKLWRHLLQDGQLTHLPLTPLSEEETTHLGAAVLHRQLDAPVAARLYHECAGNPLFVIESLRFQPGPLQVAPAQAGQRDGFTSLPPKVYAVIQARLATLSPQAHAVAELAAVAGRAFTPELLAQAGQRDVMGVALGVDELCQRRLVREQSNAHYDFSHDRIRDVAYAEISPAKRRALHRAVAQALESIHADQLDGVAGELAGHYQQADALEQALTYFRQAAAVAQRLYSHGEAARYLERAIAITQMRPDNPEFRSVEIDLWDKLGVARTWIYGWGSEPVGEAWIRLHALAMQTGTIHQRVRALVTLGGFSSNRGEWRKCHDYQKLALPLAENSGDTYLIADMFSGYARSLYHFGELEQSLVYFRHVLALVAALVPLTFTKTWNVLHDGLLIRMSLCLWLLGYPDQAHKTVHKALENNHTRVDVFDHFGSLDFSAQLYSFIRNIDMVQSLGETLIEMSQKYDFSFFLCSGQFFRGWALAHIGDARAGAVLVREGFNGMRRHGSRMLEPYSRAMLAEALALAGEHKEALEEVNAGITFADEMGNVYWNAQLLKQKGDLLQTLGAPDSEAEEWYQRALTLARAQSARSLELRAAMGLARLWHKQGKAAQAHCLLADIYGWFTEGFDTPDLKDAQLLLAELA